MLLRTAQHQCALRAEHLYFAFKMNACATSEYDTRSATVIDKGRC